MTSPSPLLSAADLPALGPVRLLCVPGACTVPAGATVVPVERWIARAAESDNGFDDLAFWQEALADLGIGPDRPTVIADDGKMTEAARVWFILQYFGLPASVLNGGLPALSPVEIAAPAAPAPVALRPGSGPVGLMDRHGLKNQLDRVQVFDARSAAEHRGEDLKNNRRGGHLPGARLLAHLDLLDGGHLRSPDAIRALLTQAGIGGAGPVVTHCNGGGRAALAALAAHLAGEPDVRVYYLSFADWAADESCPLHTP